MIDEKFNSRINKYSLQEKNLKKTLNIISTIRLISFMIIIYLGYRYIMSDKSLLFLIPSLIAIVFFVSLIIYHNKVKDNLKEIQALIIINNNYLDRINGQWIDFPDFGEDFLDKNHKYSSDLDILGPGSLFQLINLSSTWIGRNSLKEDLLAPTYDKDEILSRQKAIKELASKLDFMQNLEYESSKMATIKNPKKLISYFENKNKTLYSNRIRYFIKFLPLVSLATIGLSLIFKASFLYIITLILLIIQTALWLLGSNKNNEALSGIGSFKNNLEVYLELLKLIEKEDFESLEFEKIKSNLFSDINSIEGIKKLDIISEKINLQNTGVLYLLLNILFLWDYQTVFSLEDWKAKYASRVKEWIYSLGKIESLSSLSVFLQIEDIVSYPIIEEDLNISSISCGHPLIDSKERIYNDININNNILIITGSNMSGKTTFLRTVGINLVLLNAGTVTLSKEFKSPIMNIYTSMRVSDDLKNKISTFYAELLRIKEILNFAKNNKNTIFLIDEIFTGTNSKDRLLGAKNVLKNLNDLGLIGAITTHDFELCELDIYPRIINYHFAEDYVDGKISFDYKIKEGRSTSTNARHLMELVGIKILD